MKSKEVAGVSEVTKAFSGKTEWASEVFWTPAEVAEFLNTLTPHQALSAKVGVYEVKIMVIYPKPQVVVDDVEGF